MHTYDLSLFSRGAFDRFEARREDELHNSCALRKCTMQNFKDTTNRRDIESFRERERETFYFGPDRSGRSGIDYIARQVDST